MFPVGACAMALALAGCFSSPYDYSENWILREDYTRSFAVPIDVIYVQGLPYVRLSELKKIDAYAKNEVGHDRFEGELRVFAPLVANPEDMENAVKWYLKRHHTGHRPFAFIGEGECGRFLREYEEANEASLKKKGLVASFYTTSTHKGFVTDDMASEIKKASVRVRYHDVWNRKMPAEMQK